MSLLLCVRCRRVIEPDEPMVVVVVARPARWATAVRQLETTPGRWHYRCAPSPIRQHAPAVEAGAPSR